MMNKPVRVFDGTQRPFEAFWTVVDEADSESGEAEIQFYGYISEFSWYGDEVTPGLFAKDLKKLGGRPVTLRIHSGGGEVFAASAIRAMIMEYPGKVTARIDGLCASAATYVATAADVVKMQDSAFFMVHDPWCLALGSADELKTVARMLETIKDGIVETYVSKTKQEPAVLERWMSKETWFTAREAMEAGFVDEVISAPAKAFSFENMAVANAVRNYANVPDAVKELFTTESTENTEILEGGEGDPILLEAGMGDGGQEAEGAADETPVHNVDVAEDGGASEAPEAEDVEDGEQGDLTPAPFPDREGEREREVKSLRDYVEVFG